ncbi:MAG: luxQ 3 [Candidatus Saccharibacteria bacterium]|nr:luxQ 3 [Candidatus Saccharibacteria bacterium]
MATKQSTAQPIYNISEDIVRSAIEVSRNPLVITDNSLPDNPIVYSNPAFQELTGYSFTEVLGKPYDFLCGKETDKKTIAAVRRAVRAGTRVRATVMNYKKDGTSFWNDLTLAPIRDEDGNVTHFTGLFQDITSLINAAQRQKSLKEMGKLLARAEATQQRVKLLAAQKAELIKLNRSKDEFVSIASHQLRTPATAVKQYLGMITEGFTGEVNHHQLLLLQAAYESNERQLNVINELLRTARIDSHKYHVKPKPENITKLIRQIIANQQPIIDVRSQKVIFDDSIDYVVPVDASEIGLVIENIIENASKYSPPNRTITVTMAKKDSKLVINISDEGVGIDKAHQKIIFDKFTRVDNELSDTVTGSGLGLYWAKRILRLHKGSIRVKSAIGQGSTFTLTLPYE